MDLGPLTSNPRALIPQVLLAAFLIAEWLVPFRVSERSKLYHVSTNLVLFGTNSLIASAIAGWFLIFLRGRWPDSGWGLLQQLHIDGFSNIILSVILLDLAAYGFHWFSHRIPFLWRFHRTHHTDLDVDVTTSLRFHVGEVLISAGFTAIAASALGVSAVGFLISQVALLIGGQFAHSNIRLRDGLERWMGHVVVTPSMHLIHHSRRPSEHHSNFGVMLSFWDRLFGALVQGVNPRDIQFGLDRYTKPEDVELLRLYRVPLDQV
jgi:sterol desaturase/sphingolipid hydroxylase (fatty acid hydroxylase superfamily)